MAQVTLGGNPVHTSGDLPALGASAPAFSLVGADLSEFDAGEFAGKNVILNIFPSIDTPTCATSVRQFNERAAGMDDTVVVCVSADLPFAMGRFCGAEGIANVKVGSTFRSDFGSEYGVTLTDGVLQGVLARAVVVIGPDGTVKHTELVPEIAQEPELRRRPRCAVGDARGQTRVVPVTRDEFEHPVEYHAEFGLRCQQLPSSRRRLSKRASGRQAEDLRQRRLRHHAGVGRPRQHHLARNRSCSSLRRSSVLCQHEFGRSDHRTEQPSVGSGRRIEVVIDESIEVIEIPALDR